MLDVLLVRILSRHVLLLLRREMLHLGRHELLSVHHRSLRHLLQIADRHWSSLPVEVVLRVRGDHHSLSRLRLGRRMLKVRLGGSRGDT